MGRICAGWRFRVARAKIRLGHPPLHQLFRCAGRKIATAPSKPDGEDSLVKYLAMFPAAQSCAFGPGVLPHER